MFDDKKPNARNRSGEHLDPAVRDTIERLRTKGEKLTNGNAADMETIGQAVGELSYLFAHFLEAQPPTKHYCETTQQKLVDYVNDQIKRSRKGIGWPTALTIITATALIAATVVKVMS